MTTADCKNCCKECEPCQNCYELDKEKIRKYLYAVDKVITKHSENTICLSEWGYGCKSVAEEDLEKLLLFRSFIQDYYDSIIFYNKPSSCPNEIQRILEETSKLVNLNFSIHEDFSYVSIDDSNLENWLFENPSCQSVEDWEKHLIKYCFRIGFEVINVKEVSNFIYDVSVNSLTDNCKLLYTLSVYNIAQQGNIYSISVNEKEQCKIDYKILVNKYDCKFDYDTYIKLLECNLSHEVISNFIECGLDVSYSAKDKCAVLSTSKGKYKLADIKVNVFNGEVDECSIESIFSVDNKCYNKTDIDLLVKSYNGLNIVNYTT